MLKLLYIANENVRWNNFENSVGSFLPYDLQIPFLGPYLIKVRGEICPQNICRIILTDALFMITKLRKHPNVH